MYAFEGVRRNTSSRCVCCAPQMQWDIYTYVYTYVGIRDMRYIYICVYICRNTSYVPPEKLLRGGLWTPVPPFCLFCTIIPNKICILDQYQNRPRSYQPGPSWLPGSTPSIFQEAFCVDIYITASVVLSIQGGKEPSDALSCRSFFAKEPLIIGLCCDKWPIKRRHSMGLCYPVHGCPPTDMQNKVSFIGLFCKRDL